MLSSMYLQRFVRFLQLIFLGYLATGCAAPPLTTISGPAPTPIVSEPIISAPQPVNPGERIGVSVRVDSAPGTLITYEWTVFAGTILEGQGTNAITYEAPTTPDTYGIRVKVSTIDSVIERSSFVIVREAQSSPPERSTISIPAHSSDDTVPPAIPVGADHFVVYADQDWQDTGIDIMSGDTVEITHIADLWTVNERNLSIDPYVGPEGYTRQYSWTLLPEANLGALVGRIASEQPFSIGTVRSFMPSSSGRLYLRINDGICAECDEPLGDNAGQLTLAIRITSAVPDSNSRVAASLDLCPDTVTRNTVSNWGKIGAIDISAVQPYLDAYESYRKRGGGFVNGDTIPSGVVIATDFGNGQSEAWQIYPVKPIVHFRSWGLFEVTRSFSAPSEGSCVTISP